MIFTRYFISLSLLLLVLHGTQAQDWAMADRISKAPQAEKQPSIASTYMMIHYQNNMTTMDHRETTSASEYGPLNQESNVGVNGFSLDLSHEFLASKTISLTMSGRYGRVVGRDENEGDINTLTYRNDVSGQLFGGGATLNYNTTAFGLRMQPFIGAYYLNNSHDYDLSYANADGNSDPVNINYAIERDLMQYSAGVRFMSEKNNLMSYFSLDYSQELNKTSEVTGRQGESPITVNNSADTEYNPLSFSIGAGFSF